MIVANVHQSAEADLCRIRRSDPTAVARLLVALQEVTSHQLAETLLSGTGEFKFDSGLAVAFSRWVSASPERQIYRLKAFGDPAGHYRVIYGLGGEPANMYILAVAHRSEFDYDVESVLGKRILRDWANCTV